MATVGIAVMGAKSAALAGAAVTTAVGVGASALLGAPVLGSLYEGRRSRKMQERAMKIDERRAKLQSMRSSVQQIRQAQMARADILQMGENQGVSGSSGVAGGMASAQSQATGNIAFAQQIFGLQQSYNRMRSAANAHSFNASAFNQLGSLAGSFGMDVLKSSFSGGSKMTDAQLAAKHGVTV